MATDAAVDPMEQRDMTIWDHINELRSRILKAMAALVVTTVISVFFLANFLIDFFTVPAGGKSIFITLEPTEGVGVYMRVALLAGFILALPVIVYQILSFVIPGLYDNEKRWVFTAIPLATGLFVLGVAFTYYVMLPAALPFLRGFIDIKPAWRLSNYLDFVTTLMFWIGLSFETPLIMFMLAKFHVVSAAALLKQWRYAVVIIAVIAAVITPTPDPVNMSLVMAPLLLIYLLSVFFANLAQ